MSGQEKHLYEFGPFRLDPVKRRLLREGEPVPLTPKAFDTLLALVQQSGRTVEKDDLMRRVWPGAIVEENNLNQNITTLRKCLGDSRQASRYIATIPGLGYRFVAEVKTAPAVEVETAEDSRAETSSVVEKNVGLGEVVQVEGTNRATVGAESDAAPTANENVSSESVEPSPTAAHDEPTSAHDEPELSAPRHNNMVAPVALALVFVLATGYAFWGYWKSTTPRPAVEAASGFEVTALTRTGTTGRAVISPDGRYIVYSVAEGGRESLWLRQSSASSAQQIAPPAKVEYTGLTFSRDGDQLYFVRAETNGAAPALYRQPALGRVPTKLLDDVHSPVTLSPDGGRMAFVRNSGGKSALMVADADGGNQRQLASRPAPDNFKVPAWSPDGKVIACSAGSRDRYDFHNSVVSVRVEDGAQSPASPREWGGRATSSGSRTAADFCSRRASSPKAWIRFGTSPTPTAPRAESPATRRGIAPSASLRTRGLSSPCRPS